MKIKLKHIAAKRAYCYCPYHKDRNASMEILLSGEYEGRAYCYGCGRIVQISKPILEKLKQMAPPDTEVNGDIEDFYHKLWNDYIDNPKEAWPHHEKLMSDWNISVNTLEQLGIFWHTNKYVIPMYNEKGFIGGIQYRYPDGFKRCETGSQLGIFLPHALVQNDISTLFLTEGCSDLACLLDLGFMGIGRPNNNGSLDMVCEFLENMLVPSTKLIIIADNDGPGRDGAFQLMQKWNERHDYGEFAFHLYDSWPMTVLIPETKDLREAVTTMGKEDVTKWLKEYI